MSPGRHLFANLTSQPSSDPLRDGLALLCRWRVTSRTSPLSSGLVAEARPDRVEVERVVLEVEHACAAFGGASLLPANLAPDQHSGGRGNLEYHRQSDSC